jgi:hypothetical protein
MDELKSLSKPPQLVQVVMEAVMIVLGMPTKDWKEIKAKAFRTDLLLRL